MKKILLLTIIIVLLSACGKSDESTNSSSEDVIKPIEAVLDVPEKLDVNEAVTLSVTVTQDEGVVDDASEIEFEVWKNGEKEESKMIQANHQKDGVYTAEKTFDENGIFYVQSHVTARDMHTMPKAKITVGKVTKEAGDTKEADKETSEHHHHSNTTIDFQIPETVKVNEASAYVAKITHKGEPLENALVRMEVWKDESKKHEYVNLNEAETGTYQIEMKLDDKGTYHITVHVEKDEIHTHKEFEIETE
ncbi:FixH family protein [Virgibacillus necropolis]|uniref:FixH family protein n=1 Tax=Virgibacillus necropolis TaxID=163877 RepID=UPI00384A8F23